jgi:hypothetical protein
LWTRMQGLGALDDQLNVLQAAGRCDDGIEPLDGFDALGRGGTDLRNRRRRDSGIYGTPLAEVGCKRASKHMSWPEQGGQ